MKKEFITMVSLNHSPSLVNETILEEKYDWYKENREDLFSGKLRLETFSLENMFEIIMNDKGIVFKPFSFTSSCQLREQIITASMTNHNLMTTGSRQEFFRKIRLFFSIVCVEGSDEDIFFAVLQDLIKPRFEKANNKLFIELEVAEVDKFKNCEKWFEVNNEFGITGHTSKHDAFLYLTVKKKNYKVDTLKLTDTLLKIGENNNFH